MLTVAYELSALARSPYGGIAQACYNTALQVSKHSEISAHAMYRGGNPANITATGLTAHPWSWHSRFTSAKVDILHALCHKLPSLRARRIVYTVHDAWSLYPNPYQGVEFQKQFGRRMRAEIERSDMIIADSEATRRRLLELGVASENRCRTVHLGVSAPNEIAITDSRKLIDDVGPAYVLFVGRHEYRKNLRHIVEAVRPLSGVNLVLVGEPGHGYEESVVPHLAVFPRERLRRYEHLSPGELTALYRNAVATLLPSWEEGFGLPILEAMAAGSPVITSDRSASEEIAGDAAILVNPEDPHASEIAIVQLLEDPAFRDRLIASGKARAAQFTWTSYFNRLLDIYRSL